MQALLTYCPENEYYLYFKRGHVPKLNFSGKYTVREVDIPYFMWRTPMFTRVLERDGIDVFHSTAYTVPLVPRRLRRVALVSTFHGLHSEYFRWPPKEAVYSVANYRSAAKFADRIICVSDTLRHEIHEKYGKPLGEMDLTYLGIDERMRPLAGQERKRAARHIKDKYRLCGEDFIVYVGGGMARNKNLKTILEAWSLLKGKYSLGVPLVATRIDTSKLRGTFRRLGLVDGKDVIGLKWMDGADLPLLYACAAICVYPSIYEGLGWPVLEAMRSGTPVITSKVSTMPEAAGGAGILVESPMDAEEWARRIFSLYSDRRLRARLTKLGISRAKGFTWEKGAKETIKSYRKAIAQLKRSRA